MQPPVIVVGAGPTGLMLAAELRLGGAPTVVLEQLTERTGESRGLGFSARTMEIFDQRDLLPQFGEIETSSLGHFGGLPIDFAILDGVHYGVKGISQSWTEAVLEQRALDLGAEIRRGWLVEDLVDDGDGVTVHCRVDGQELHERGSYVVGCDGGHSVVRRHGRFTFPGTAPTRELLLADVRGCEIEPRPVGQTVEGGMVMTGQLEAGVHRIVISERGAPPRRRDAPPSFDEVASAWRRLTGQDISGGEAVWTSAFGDPARQAAEYRRGRLLVAGDAAHVHLPAGGQGMNVGIQDALNLGWKLAAVTEGHVSAELLDTYHNERHPVGARLLTNVAAQAQLFLTGEEMQPVRDVLAELIQIEAVARHLIGMVSGLDVRYDVGGGDHPLLGRRLPPTEVQHEGRVVSTNELLRAGSGVLLDLVNDSHTESAVAGWSDRVTLVRAECRAATPSALPVETALLLVRPDGYVAWADPGSTDDLVTALRQWFGEARAPRPERI